MTAEERYEAYLDTALAKPLDASVSRRAFVAAIRAAEDAATLKERNANVEIIKMVGGDWRNWIGNPDSRIQNGVNKIITAIETGEVKT